LLCWTTTPSWQPTSSVSSKGWVGSSVSSLPPRPQHRQESPWLQDADAFVVAQG
jgi:hypothetical protein